jgi:hypothetical protein
MRSQLEQDVALRLDELGVIWEYETWELAYLKPIRNAVCLECEASDVYSIRNYTPDFYLPEYGCLLEVKGKFGQVDRMKMRLVKQQHEDEDIRMVFSRNNLIGRKAQTSTRYIDYAQQYGMPACVLENLTLEWLNG